jgi:hypothetical protein
MTTLLAFLIRWGDRDSIVCSQSLTNKEMVINITKATERDPPAGIGVPPRPHHASSDPAVPRAAVPRRGSPPTAVRGDAPPSTSMRGCRRVSRFLVVDPPPGEVRRRRRPALPRRHRRRRGRRPDVVMGDWSYGFCRPSSPPGRHPAAAAAPAAAAPAATLPPPPPAVAVHVAVAIAVAITAAAASAFI